MAYRGQIAPIPVGLQGFSGSKSPSKMGPGHFSYVEGVDIDGGILVKEGGAMHLNAVALGGGADVLAGINWSPLGGSFNDVVMLGDGTARKDTGLTTFPTTLRSGLAIPNIYPPFFVTGGGETVGATRKLFLCTEVNQMQVVSGTANTMAAISAPAADWASAFPIFAVQHDLRMWAGGNANDPHRIYYSSIDDHQEYDPTAVGSSAGQLAVYPGEGEGLVGGISFRGLLLLFKRPAGVYVVDTRDPTVANWQVQKLNGSVGAAGPCSIVRISNDILILDQAGNFHLMTGVTDFGDVNASNIGLISDISTFMRSDTSLVNMHKAAGVWYTGRSKAWFMVPLVGAVFNTLRIVIDFTDAQVGPRFYLSRRDTGLSIWIRPDSFGVGKPVLGDDEGFVWLMDQDSRNKEGVAYDFLFETAETDFAYADPALATKFKTAQFIEVVADLINATNLTITPYWDGQPSDPIGVTLGGVGAALGTFTLDIDVLGSAGIVTERRRMTGSGRRLKLNVENNTLDDEVRLSEIRAEFHTGDERTSG